VRTDAVVERIRALVIPPAWTDVWICPLANGHIQAVGTDAAGRRQYLYHPAWRERRDQEKFDRMLEFARALPRLRRVTGRHLQAAGMPRERSLACAVRLLDRGFFRIGGETYAEENGSYGLATMRKEHVAVRGAAIVFDYPAKSGRVRLQSVVDADVREVVAALRRRRAGGPELLAYRDGREWRDVRSADINAYIKEIAGEEYSAKDFRTWHGTVLASVALAVSFPAVHSPTARKRAIVRAVHEVSHYLGNTPAVCRRSYIDPRVIDRFDSGDTVAWVLGKLVGDLDGPGVQPVLERAVVHLLSDSDRPRQSAPVALVA
jgi:DNA topoisomerase IB